MASIDWNTLTLKELKDIQKQATKAIANFEKRRKQEAVVALEAKASEMGFALKDLVGSDKGSVTKSRPKYAHPDNRALTWTGRGRQPRWIKEGLAEGKSLGDFAI